MDLFKLVSNLFNFNKLLALYFIYLKFKVIFAIFRVGKIYKYISKASLRGFTTAAACYVFTTQLHHVLGIYPQTRHNPPVLKLIYVSLNFNVYIKV